MTNDKMFTPFPGSKKECRSGPRATGGGWYAIVPVPATAPDALAEHPSRGSPSIVWVYRDTAGAVLGYVLRFNSADRGKLFLPLTFCEHPDTGRREWRWKSWNSPRPLYGLDRLAAHPEALVVVCEGEKAADAAGKLLPADVAVTSPNGSKSAGKADWGPLAGRRVVIWPDADPAGEEYGVTVCHALDKTALSVAVILPPAGVAPGWDAADAIAEGWDTSRTTALVLAASTHETARTVADGSYPMEEQKKGARRSRPTSIKDRLVKLTAKVEFWHCANGEPYATVIDNGHRENWRVRSDHFRNWLADRCFDKHGDAPAGQTVEDVCRILAMRARRGPEYPISQRVAEHGGRLYIDRGDPTRSVIMITETTWEVIGDPPVKFLRSNAMCALPAPERGESVDLLRSVLNPSGEAAFKMMVGWVVGAFALNGPYPILILNGEQGSAKSAATEVLRRLVDPNAVPLRAPPRDERDLVVSIHNAWVIALDNVSSIPNWLADALCRIATGAGFATRRLHSDRDEILIGGAHPIILNGIPDLVSRADLADRSLVVTLAPIPSGSRRTEQRLRVEVEEMMPAVFGAVCDALVAAVANRKIVMVEGCGRMADFEQWVTAAEPGLGWEAGSFHAAYAANRESVVDLSVENDPVASAAAALATEVIEWEASPTEMLSRLGDFVSEPVRKSRAWPTTASALSNRLRRAAPVLRQVGIDVETGARLPTRDRKRLIRIRKIG